VQPNAAVPSSTEPSVTIPMNSMWFIPSTFRNSLSSAKFPKIIISVATIYEGFTAKYFTYDISETYTCYYSSDAKLV